jgi:hypothetical protein
MILGFFYWQTSYRVAIQFSASLAASMAAAEARGLISGRMVYWNSAVQIV